MLCNDSGTSGSDAWKSKDTGSVENLVVLELHKALNAIWRRAEASGAPCFNGLVGIRRAIGPKAEMARCHLTLPGAYKPHVLTSGVAVAKRCLYDSFPIPKSNVVALSSTAERMSLRSR